MRRGKDISMGLTGIPELRGHCYRMGGDELVIIVDLSKTIGTRIVVEGVEHKEQFELLKGLGVDYIQGYYFGKPVPANIFEENNLEGRLGE